MLDAAEAAGWERFALINNAKAVEPSSVRGGSKRLAQLALFGDPDGPLGPPAQLHLQ